MADRPREAGAHRAKCIGGARERNEERVALRVHLDAVAAAELLAKDGPVRRGHIGVPVAEPLQELGRAFDVGEDEGDGALRDGSAPGALPSGRRLIGVPAHSGRSTRRVAACREGRKAAHRQMCDSPVSGSAIRRGLCDALSTPIDDEGEMMERRVTGTGSPDGMDDVYAALDVLRHRQLDLQRRHEVLIEYVARYPNAVNCRQEREISSARSAVASGIGTLEQWLSRREVVPAYQ
jgi:hypothetical protein